ncbi:MAG: SDR family oxidoreductase, partial [Vicinamibacterales bacterium]
MPDSRVLVAGATGQLGGVIARKLLAAGVPVRALARSAEKLAPLKAAGAEVAAVNLVDLAKVTDACRGISQIVSTANNNMGKGPTSPMKIDVSAYQNLCAAARNTGVKRLIYVSFRGVTSGETVDIFRVKWYIEDLIRRSGLPHVIVRPTAFMDVWIDQILAPDIRKGRTATVFGDGSGVANYIAVDDVAEFVVKIVARDDVKNENVEIGGPSDLSLNDLV